MTQKKMDINCRVVDPRIVHAVTAQLDINDVKIKSLARALHGQLFSHCPDEYKLICPRKPHPKTWSQEINTTETF
jgi:hypothetical protein